MTEKVCTKCSKGKLLNAKNFCTDRSRRDGFAVWCKSCVSEYQKTYNRDHRKQDAASMRAWRAANPGRAKAIKKRAYLRSMYRITQGQYEEMFERQGRACASCRVTEKDNPPLSDGRSSWAVDHNHETGKIRGILCQKCNLTLGNARESVHVLSSLIQYIARHEKVFPLTWAC